MGLKATWIIALGGLFWLSGCAREYVAAPKDMVVRGQFGKVRTQLYHDITHDRDDPDVILEYYRVGVMTLADGYASSARTIFDDLYDMLRTQGINRDKEAAAALLNEDVKTWKGEPYEQALAMMYIAMTHAQLGSWDNARAASGNAQLLLRNLASKGEVMDDAAIMHRARIYEQAIAQGDTPQQAREKAEADAPPEYLRDAAFTLASLLAGIANQQLGRDDEAQDHYRRANELNDAIAPILQTLRQGDYNAILVVSYGAAPRKELAGNDQSRVRWTPRTDSDPQPLLVRLDDDPAMRVAVAEDINQLAHSYNWNRYAKLRAGKSTAGDLLILGGTVATTDGAHRGSGDTVAGGIGAIGAGVLLKVGSHGDPRYNDVLPQRYYLVPLTLTSPDQRITLKIEGQPDTRLILTGLAPSQDAAVLRYIRLPTHPARWARTGQRMNYTPPRNALMTIQDQNGYAGLHVLEGGHSAVRPDSATVGDARLFGKPTETQP